MGGLFVEKDALKGVLESLVNEVLEAQMARHWGAEWHKRSAERVQNLLNHRPRKTLGYLTPHEVLVERKPIVVQRQSVALVT